MDQPADGSCPAQDMCGPLGTARKAASTVTADEACGPMHELFFARFPIRPAELGQLRSVSADIDTHQSILMLSNSYLAVIVNVCRTPLASS